MKKAILSSLACVFTIILFGKSCTGYQNQSEPPSSKSDSLIARGTVFHDVNGNGKLDSGDPLFAGVRVSNGQQIVVTNERGRYELPIEEDSAIFVIKPSGFRTAMGKNRLPKFFYIHKPNGSPKLRFAGVKPTGNLPKSIDFPLYRQNEPETFRILLFGDPQPRNKTEVDYISHDVISELIGDKSAFGVTLGDIAFDNLQTFEPLNQSIALIGIPWYNVIGNHDINIDAQKRKHINETFERVYGPSYYSFDYGQVHFVVLDNIDWAEPNERVNRHHFTPNFGSDQLRFLKQDLAMIPESQLVVLLMHVPIISTNDKTEFFKLIENRPFCVSISAHQHIHRHLFLGKEDGFNGPKQHHHIVNVTVSGSWWSGLKNENGIPHSTMADGAPNGYSYMTFSRDQYSMEFKAAGRPASEQMNVQFPNIISPQRMENAELFVNVFNGNEKSIVEYAVDDAEIWTQIEKVSKVDPHYLTLYENEQNYKPPIEPKLTKPKISHHLWAGKLNLITLSSGTHLLRVRTTDSNGRTYYGHRSFRVVK